MKVFPKHSRFSRTITYQLDALRQQRDQLLDAQAHPVAAQAIA
jgi:hypothetical protein